MKNIFKRILALLCSSVILSATICSSYAYASESDRDIGGHTSKSLEDIQNDVNKKLGLDNTPPDHYINSVISWLIGQSGALFNGDMKQIDNNDKWFQEQWNKDKIKVRRAQNSTDDNPKYEVVINKSVTDTLLTNLKEQTKNTDGYTLVKTVPMSVYNKALFEVERDYQTLINLFKKHGMVGVQLGGNTSTWFTKIDEPETGNYYYVGSKGTYDGEEKFIYVSLYSSVYKSCDTFGGYYVQYRDKEATDFDDNMWNGRTGISGFYTYEYYLEKVKEMEKYNYMPYYPLKGVRYLVTKTGACIPVFETINDVLKYQIANNLYYTSSAYTGEGKEIVIDYDQLDKILGGYYDGMYDMLQQLIEQQGNALTPEQLQELTDSILASFDMIKGSIEEGFKEQDILIQKNSSILQNIADALNDFFKKWKSALFPSTGSKSYIEKTYDEIKDIGKDIHKILNTIRVKTVADTVFNVADFIENLLDPDKKLDTITDFVKTGVNAFNDVTELVQDKFPFCIPVDIYVIMHTFSHEPIAPKWELPLKLETFGIDEKIIIDFSQLQIISELSRSLLTIIYCITLMNATTKILNLKNL